MNYFTNKQLDIKDLQIWRSKVKHTAVYLASWQLKNRRKYRFKFHV